MKRAIIAGVAVAAVLALLTLAVNRALDRRVPFAASPSPAAVPPPAGSPEGAHPSFLYGRVAADDGVTYEGRLRWGGGEEAFWGDYFNGAKKDNPWVAYAPPERLKERRPIEIFGLQIASRERPIDFGRLFMARFGDIARIEASGRRDVRVTLKSGAVFVLDRYSAGDFDDGVRVWDDRRGVVDLGTSRIRSIELLPIPRLGAAPNRLHGAVRSRQGDFTGFLQWTREQCLGADKLDGRTADGELSLRFDAIRSIARRSPDSSLVTLLDGREIALSGARDVGDEGNRGVYIDDPRYGRVLVSWSALESVEFTRGASGPSYGDFPPGGPLTGSVTTRAGRRLAGRLVYDLDESEVTDTFDAPSHGVNYTIPFGLIASIVLTGSEEARLTLRSGEELLLERAGDLGAGNAGMLIFVEGNPRPEYVPWTEVAQVELDRPPAMYPPLGRR